MVDTEVSQEAAAPGPTVQIVTDYLKKSVTCKTTGHNSTEDVAAIVFTLLIKKKANQSHYRPEVPRGFQEVKVPRYGKSGTGGKG